MNFFNILYKHVSGKEATLSEEKIYTDGMKYIPRDFYYIILGDRKNIQNRVRWLSSTSIIDLLPFVINKNLKIEMYEALKERVFNYKVVPDVIRKIVLTIDFSSALLEYLKLQRKINRIKKQ